MRQSALLDDYMQRMASVAPDDMLRWTGEELAHTAERLPRPTVRSGPRRCS